MGMDNGPRQHEPSSATGTSAEKDPLRASAASRSWAALAVSVLLMIVLVVFIVQNTQQVQVSFLVWDGHPPLAVALLCAAVAGAALAVVVGSLRIWQVRRRVRRSR
jgi:uncharacterized integral membrane protein